MGTRRKTTPTPTDTMGAIVTLPKLEGRGVLVPGGLIITAAHCLTCDYSCGMWELHDHLEDVQLANGKTISAALVAVDPLNDLAVLGEPDGQRFFGESDHYEEFVDETTPVNVTFRLTPGSFPSLAPIPHPWKITGTILNMPKKWVNGIAQIRTDFPSHIHFQTRQRINRGASGGPILNEDGELVAVISNASEERCGSSFTVGGPIVMTALPHHVIYRIVEAQQHRKKELEKAKNA